MAPTIGLWTAAWLRAGRTSRAATSSLRPGTCSTASRCSTRSLRAPEIWARVVARRGVGLASSVVFARGALRLALLGALLLGCARPGGGAQPRRVGRPIGGGPDDLVALLRRTGVEIRDPGVE